MTIYQNQDLDLNKFFVCDSESTIIRDIKKLSGVKINREAYLRPSGVPMIDVLNTTKGSWFEGFHIPTASVQFIVEDNKIIEKKTVEKNLKLQDYQEILLREIDRSIEHIFQQHKSVVLCFSGGIDSVFLLSRIIELGHGKRTDIVVFSNQTQTNPTCLHIDPEQKNILDELLLFIGPYVGAVNRIQVTVDDVASAFNLYADVAYVKCYATSSLLHQYQNTAFIFGHHGNQVLLHKFVFLDEIISRRSGARTEIENFLNKNSDYYCQGIKSYDFKKIPVGIEHVHMLQKPWAALDGTNNNKIYSPLANDKIFNSLRKLDFTKVSIDTIIDARFPKSMIESCQLNDILQFVKKESLHDLDTLLGIQVPIEKLDQKLLVIPDNLQHDHEGVDYIRSEISDSTKTGYMPINSLVSIKALNWVSSLF